VLQWLAEERTPVVVLDKLEVRGKSRESVSVEQHPEYKFVCADIVDGAEVRRILDEQKLRAVVQFAAESHADRSILGPREFICTNIECTFQLFEAVRSYWSALRSRV
jgi:dTDP-glucose 4,6-dehydratase